MSNSDYQSAFPQKIEPKTVPASVVFRTLAFLADSVLAFIVTLFVLKISLPIFSPEGVDAVFDYSKKFFDAYTETINDAARGVVSSAKLDAISAAATQDATLNSFFTTINTISLIVTTLYFLLSEQFMRGQTLGKKIFGLRTVIAGTEDEPPTFFQTLSRSFWKAITIVPAGIILIVLTIINAHVVVFAKRHRGWHDKISRTEVIDERATQKE